MNILCILTDSIGGRLTSKSIFDGFVQNGHYIFVYDVLNPTKISEKKFDYIVGYDFSAIKYNLENKLNLKTINYFSDIINSPTSGKDYEKYYKELKKEGNYTFCWEKEEAEKEGVCYLPHFVNCEVYKNENLPCEYDVMFAGRLDTDLRLKTLLNLMKDLPDVKFGWFAIEKHYENALSRCSEEEKKLIKKAYRGFLDTEEKMAKAINKTKIVYNINAQGKSSLNYRTFQTAACEKLVISDKRKDLDLFDREMPFYENYEDLREKINFYLKNEENYKKTVILNKKTVQNSHNSKENIKKILEKIK